MDSHDGAENHDSHDSHDGWRDIDTTPDDPNGLRGRRVLVMGGGRITGEVAIDECSEATLGCMMGGASREARAH